VAVWRIPRARAFYHPGDDALTLLALVGPGGVSAAIVSHVTSCSQCAVRLAALEQRLAEDRRAAVAEADHTFQPPRLERQRASVLRRIGGSRAAARILPFPAHGPVVVTPRHQIVRRSVAAAAVAGLLIGVFAGRLLDPTRQFFRSSSLDRQASVTRQGVQTVRAAVVSDEDFLLDFEAALGAPRVEALQALDELTPLAAEDSTSPFTPPYN
jgi:hypothetical protein